MAEQVRHGLRHDHSKPRSDCWRNAGLVWVLLCSGINPLEVYIKSSYPSLHWRPLTSVIECKNIEEGMLYHRWYISQGLISFFPLKWNFFKMPQLNKPLLLSSLYRAREKSLSGSEKLCSQFRFKPEPKVSRARWENSLSWAQALLRFSVGYNEKMLNGA